MQDLAGKRVVIMGLGRFGGGVGAARYCCEQGAKVLVTDSLGQADLQSSLDRLADLPIEYRLGGHDEADFASADVVVVNPGVDRRNNRYLQAANGAATTTEIRLFIDTQCTGAGRLRTIGVTGTAGKSTTVAMIGHILAEAHGPDRVHVGGNIGGSLLDRLDRIRPDDWVVLELSSFMLELIDNWSPHIGVMTNLADNHLDRHGTMGSYLAAKQKIFLHQSEGDVAVVPPMLAEWSMITPARSVVADPFFYAGQLQIPGDHNRSNASSATAAAVATGVKVTDCARFLAGFTGLPHRLQRVAEHNGVRFFNDSKCTTPEAAILAIDSFKPRTAHVILGGYNKGADLRHVALHAARQCAGIYTVGQTGDAIADAALPESDRCPVHRCGDLETAVRHVLDNVRPDQEVLLSPACASWDQFDNYEQRGKRFVEYVLKYTGAE
ncbi:MAG: UDP-N-acetylmuramoyl-L-alanine--D-glutamate ligase [Phycisphaeraceae bacterium]|nr:UDP-N-acetylmuramoyl-L-alanine--D-glutamate ligase [Phycisphaeraceae bacterium]